MMSAASSSPLSSLTGCSPSDKSTSGTASLKLFFAGNLSLSLAFNKELLLPWTPLWLSWGLEPQLPITGCGQFKIERIVLGHGFRGIQTCSAFWHYSIALSPTGSTLQTQADPPNSHRVLSKFTRLYWAAIQYVIASYNIASLGCTCPMSCGLGMPSGE